ncbi:MAG: hypothetical protein LBV37_02625 [Mycoplasmataceae bacterium]|nr:hypothetical protein [Mycoplasmataceae bacterium]
MTYALFVYAWSPKESKVSTFSFATYCAASLIFLVVFLVSPETTFANFPEMAFGGLEITFYAWYSFIYHAIFFVIFFLIIINYSCPLKRVSVLYATAGIEGYLLFTYIISCILVWTMHFEPSAVDWNMLLSSSKFPPMEPLFATLGLWSGLIMSMLISLATGIIFALFYFSKNKINHLLLAPPIEKNTINTINLLFFFKHNI